MVCGNLTAVCGWEELFFGKPLQAVYTMFDFAFAGWLVILLFLVYQFILFMKVRNLTLNFVTAALFVTLFGVSQFVKPFSMPAIFLILLLSLTSIIYIWIYK